MCKYVGEYICEKKAFGSLVSGSTCTYLIVYWLISSLRLSVRHEYTDFSKTTGWVVIFQTIITQIRMK